MTDPLSEIQRRLRQRDRQAGIQSEPITAESLTDSLGALLAAGDVAPVLGALADFIEALPAAARLHAHEIIRREIRHEDAPPT